MPSFCPLSLPCNRTLLHDEVCYKTYTCIHCTATKLSQNYLIVCYKTYTYIALLQNMISWCTAFLRSAFPATEHYNTTTTRCSLLQNIIMPALHYNTTSAEHRAMERLSYCKVNYCYYTIATIAAVILLSELFSSALARLGKQIHTLWNTSIYVKRQTLWHTSIYLNM